MVGSLVGAGMSAVGSIFGGIKASRAAKKAKRNIEAQQRDNQNWYDRRYNEDATQRGDAQRLLTMTEESIRNRNRAAAGTQAVMGGTEESVAAAKEANNSALSDAVSGINAAADARKDAIEQQYMSRKDQLQGQLNQIEQGRAQSIATATAGVLGAAGSVAGVLDDAFSKKPRNESADKETNKIV